MSIATFDVFLSHNSRDKPLVKTLGTALKQRGLNVGLDEWELRPELYRSVRDLPTPPGAFAERF